MKNGLKGLVMLALAYFLFSRITNGTLFFYINNRFAWLTFLAVVGFFAVALGYLYQAQQVRQMLDGAEDRRLGAPGSTNEEDQAQLVREMLDGNEANHKGTKTLRFMGW